MDIKLTKCICGNESPAPIQYGNPTPIMIERAKEEKIALGGIYEMEYTHYCYSCNDTIPPTVWPLPGSEYNIDIPFTG